MVEYNVPIVFKRFIRPTIDNLRDFFVGLVVDYAVGRWRILMLLLLHISSIYKM